MPSTPATHEEETDHGLPQPPPSDAPDEVETSAAWVFSALAEVNPFHTEFESERTAVERLFAGESMFALIKEAQEITRRQAHQPN